MHFGRDKESMDRKEAKNGRWMKNIEKYYEQMQIC